MNTEQMLNCTIGTYIIPKREIGLFKETATDINLYGMWANTSVVPEDKYFDYLCLKDLNSSVEFDNMSFLDALIDRCKENKITRAVLYVHFSKRSSISSKNIANMEWGPFVSSSDKHFVVVIITGKYELIGNREEFIVEVEFKETVNRPVNKDAINALMNSTDIRVSKMEIKELFIVNSSKNKELKEVYDNIIYENELANTPIPIGTEDQDHPSPNTHYLFVHIIPKTVNNMIYYKDVDYKIRTYLDLQEVAEELESDKIGIIYTDTIYAKPVLTGLSIEPSEHVNVGDKIEVSIDYKQDKPVVLVVTCDILPASGKVPVDCTGKDVVIIKHKDEINVLEKVVYKEEENRLEFTFNPLKMTGIINNNNDEDTNTCD